MNVELLEKKELEYFTWLNKEFGITYLSVDETGFIFKEEELPKFFISNESPELGLEKIMNLRKITKSISTRINFNYSINIETIQNQIKISLEFHE